MSHYEFSALRRVWPTVANCPVAPVISQLDRRARRLRRRDNFSLRNYAREYYREPDRFADVKQRAFRLASPPTTNLIGFFLFSNASPTKSVRFE